MAIIERAALEARRGVLPSIPWQRLSFLDPSLVESGFAEVPSDPRRITVIDPVGSERVVTPGSPTPEDARGAIAALDLGVRMARGGLVDALVTAPLSKIVIARHLLPDFRGHTDYLASAAGLERYGRDYLMAFLAPDLRVALLSTHLPLSEALAAVNRQSVLEALRCLHRHSCLHRQSVHLQAGGRIAVAGLNPHAGEEGLLGREEDDHIRPAVAAARREGIDAHGPESPDSLFARARRGEFDWVLALYHDQGLIAVKTAAFGAMTNLTLGLPFLRTSVDHGTAYAIAGRGLADAAPLKAVVKTTLRLLSEA